MIQGTSSNVGKSLLVAALCRIYARRGMTVFPFKSQNMALNSFATLEGLEIGRAQALQANACYRSAQVDMNPILLKPEGDGHSQIVLMGKPWKTLKGRDYYKSKPELWNSVTAVLDRICKENDLIVIEGAGSPAEINLKKHEIVNMAVAKYLNAPVLLTADIDRGGVFAFLYGTLELLEPDERELVKGFIINKFRGDVSLLQPGLDMLKRLTDNRPTLGVIPYMKDIQLAQEDSVFLEENLSFGEGETDIAIILLPHISNYDDFDALTMEKGLKIRFVDKTHELGRPSAILIPGTKTTIADLYWLKSTGLAGRITALSREAVPVGGICGGYQMLGKQLTDESGTEGISGSHKGLGLLDLMTVFQSEKKTIQSTGTVCSHSGFLNHIYGSEVEGYEIHMGTTTGKAVSSPLFCTGENTFDGAVSADGLVWGTYFHGVFDEVTFRRGWLKSLGWQESAPGKTLAEKREEELNTLADTVENNMDMKLLGSIIGI